MRIHTSQSPTKSLFFKHKHKILEFNTANNEMIKILSNSEGIKRHINQQTIEFNFHK